MGGKVLEFPWEKLYKEAEIKGEAKGKEAGEASGRAKGRAEGKAEGKIEELLSLVYDGIVDFDIAAKRAKRYGINEADFQDMLDRYDPEENLLQG